MKRYCFTFWIHALGCLLGLGIFVVCLPSAALAASAVLESENAPHYFLRFFGVSAKRAAAAVSRGSHWQPPHLQLSLGGAPVRAVLDTGSTGIVVSSRFIPHIDALESIPGAVTYSSSGRIMQGRWVRVAATLTGANGVAVRTQPLYVLAVDNIACRPNARACQATAFPPSVAMIGIGFARSAWSAATQPEPIAPHPAVAAVDPADARYDRPGGDAVNPLLQLDAPFATGLHAGYILTAQGIDIGLSSDDVGEGFTFVKLRASPKAGSRWEAARACIRLSDAEQRYCGTALVDTGVDAMYMTLPRNAPQVPTTLAPDSDVEISLSPDDAQSNRYTFRLDDAKNDLAPSAVHLRLLPDTVFVNTSGAVLNAFDVMYDHRNGYVAYRRVR
jgi:hypothetical protein